jgi:hypothetical protein
VVSGVVLKEWQRTPKKLVEEYCQKHKRPRPCYSPHKSEKASSGSGSGSGGKQLSSGTGSVRSCLTLPDPKQPDKLSLKFLTDQGFATAQEAEHASALLALLHLSPGLPLERVLPEPFRSMWLQLVGRPDASDPSSSSSSEGGGAGGKKGKKVAAWRVAEEEAARAKAEEALRRERELLQVCVCVCVCLCVCGPAVLLVLLGLLGWLC